MALIAGDPETDRDTSTAAADDEEDPPSLRRPPFPSPGAVRRRAYRFDGQGGFFPREWDLASAPDASVQSFDWFHVDLPKGSHKLSVSAQLLIDALCPPLKLQDILSLVSNGPFCAHVDGALIFRVNSPGPATSDFTLRLAARVTEASVITVSLGRVPRLGFSVSPTGQSLLSEIPVVERSRVDEDEEEGVRGGIVIREHVLEFLLTMNHSEEADNPVPSTVSHLVVHIIDTHVDHVQDIVTRLEMELDAVELELDKGQTLVNCLMKCIDLILLCDFNCCCRLVNFRRVLFDNLRSVRGGSALKKQMLDDRRFPKMHLDLQRLLQAVSHGEQVFPRVKEKCAGKAWFLSENIVALEELIGRLRRLKENLGFIVNRVTAIQAGLDSWQAEQINRKLYYLSFLSLIFLPLSIVTGVFGMNVGGVPWTGQKDPDLKDGFRNVLLLCAIMLMLLLLCFTFPTIYAHISAWRRRAALKRSWSLNRKSFLKRTLRRGAFEGGGGYIRL